MTDVITEEDIIQLILGLKGFEQRKSTLQLALATARFCCNYDKEGDLPARFAFRQNTIDSIKNGEPCIRNTDEGDIFISLMLYLNCLEQIGDLFCPKDNNADNNGIMKAIRTFSKDNLSEKEIEAIKCLRHALSHNFGLVRSKCSPFHKFSIAYQNSDSHIIQLPQIPWNKDYSDKSERSNTKISAFGVIIMAEQIIDNVIKEYKQGKLMLSLPRERVLSEFTICLK